MRRQLPIFLVLAIGVLAGCQPQMPVYFHQKGEDLSHYLGMATDLDYPDVSQPKLSEVDGAIAPFSLTNSEPREIWELKLEDAIRYALENSKVMRSIGGQILGAPELLTRSIDAAPTIYDPALVESNARTGVEAALSAFDAQLTTDIFWEHNDEPRNVSPQFSFFLPQVFTQDTAEAQTQLSKTDGSGNTWTVRNNTVYDFEKSNRSRLLFPADWTTNIEAEVRVPLLQGGGVQYNRIAGPGAIPGFNNGVMIARINTDIALTNFEAGVRSLVSDVEVAYWEVYFAYRNLDAVVTGRNFALETWRKVHAREIEGAKGGAAADEAQAREQYFLFRSSVEQGLSSLYAAESKLRYIMGLAATDGRLIRPSEEPTTAKVTFDWAETHSEALCRAVEIREQKWRIKQRELELIAAKNYLLPRLDFVGRYRWLGMGEDLLDTGHSTLATGEFSQFGGAFQNMLDGNYQDWHLELQGKIPIGFRKELSGVRNAQVGLARERARLQELELEVSHQISYAIRDLEANLVLAQSNYNRRVAAQRQVDAVNAAYETNTSAGDVLFVLLQAQRTLAQAESDYYRSAVNYVKSISTVHFRKGSLLEYDGVFLAEGPWPAKAYFDAKRRARARDAAHYLDYGFTLPKVVSRGSYQQQMGQRTCAGGVPQPTMTEGPVQQGDGTGAVAPQTPEVLPTPAGEPAAPGAATEPRPSVQPGQVRPMAPAAMHTGAAKARDLGSLDLSSFAVKPAVTQATPVQQWSPIKQAGYAAPERTVEAPADAGDSGSGWKAARR